MSLDQNQQVPNEKEAIPCGTIESARDQAVRWLSARGVTFGPARHVSIGRLGVLAGKEVGVEALAGARPWWRLRLDWDPVKGAHYNAEYYPAQGTAEKQPFSFGGGIELIEALRRSRHPIPVAGRHRER